MKKPAGEQNLDVARVANLARLSLSDGELEMFQRQLKDIVRYVENIEQVDVEGVEATSHAVPMSNVFRADECRKGLDREDVLANAPASDGRHFIVPRIV